MQGAQLVNNAAEGPDVALFVVFLIMYLLRRHIVRRAHVRKRKLRLVVQDARQPKVSELDVAVEV